MQKEKKSEQRTKHAGQVEERLKEIERIPINYGPSYNSDQVKIDKFFRELKKNLKVSKKGGKKK